MRTQALCEAYLLTKDQKLLKYVGPAVQSIIDGQNENGGWAYQYGKGKKSPYRSLSYGMECSGGEDGILSGLTLYWY